MTLHDICEASRQADCWCGAKAGQDCTCGHRGVHYSRLTRAYRAGYVTITDFGEAIHDDVFTGTDVLLDPEETP